MRICSICKNDFEVDQGEINEEGQFLCADCAEEAAEGKDTTCPECGEISEEYDEEGECPSCGHVRGEKSEEDEEED